MKRNKNISFNFKKKENSSNMKYYLLLKDLKKSILPNSNILIHLINQMKKLLIKSNNIIYLKFNDKNSSIRIYGDLHGQYYDLLSTFNELDINLYNIFLGDYVDRGINSIETMIFIILLKLISPNKTILIRGNHEFEDITHFYGFKAECIEKYDIYIYEKFIDIFKYLPVCCIIETQKEIQKETNELLIKRFFCVHGGITDKDNLMEEITKIDRTRPNKYIMDLFWSDPNEIEEGFINNPRGAGVLYSEKPFNEFLINNKFDYMIRSHQLVMDGFKTYFNNKLLLVWSAPNYGYRQGNKASYIKIDINSELDYEVIYFEMVKEQFKKNIPPNNINIDYYILNE